MDEGAAALLAQAGGEPADVPEAETQARGCPSAGNPVLEDKLQGVIPMELVLAHGDPLRVGGHRPSRGKPGEPSIASPSG